MQYAATKITLAGVFILCRGDRPVALPSRADDKRRLPPTQE